MTGFWDKTKKSIILTTVNTAGGNSPESLAELLRHSKQARECFWPMILDRDNFSKWSSDSKAVLINYSGWEAFTTISQHPAAMAIVMAVTTIPLLAISLLFGSTAGLLPGLILGGVAIAISHLAGYLNNEEREEMGHAFD